MGGRDPPRGWGDGGLRDVSYKLGGDSDLISVEVNNVLTEKKIHNVFGVIKGFVDAGTGCHVNLNITGYQVIPCMYVL